ncbi:receptor-like protein kinase [Hibiscus syriacus]|uniref:Receptor-like protein kinase n=1 Tax=Hibiscus syriacus TaxID=106335 RepID=A0A6A2YA93_HIBSY|nr:receptor-like protein kinase [Hibiscus syriacus]
MDQLLPLLLVSFSILLLNQPAMSLLPNQCNDKCGSLHIPFPFHLNASCPSISTVFRLSCLNSTTLYLHIGTETYRVLDFFSDGVLVDFPGTTGCRQYNDLNAFGFTKNNYFGISSDNVIGLYDCEDSSLCKAGCETNDLPGCDGNYSGSLACCYSLSDHSIWHSGDGLSSFSKFGCRGFSSWLVSRGSNTGKRGVKLEWAVPRNSSDTVCASDADMVNATAVEAAVRCLCKDGFVGDGFADGAGCYKSCIKEGQEAYGEECNSPKHSQRKLVILAGVFAPVFILASLFLFLCIVRRPVKPGAFHLEQTHYHGTASFRKTCRTRLFTYRELEEATRAFVESQKLVNGANGTIHAGVLGDGSHIAVQKVQCETERDLIDVLSRIELLSSVLHRNLARLLGCCIESGYTILVVYEYPANGTLEEHLQNSRGQKFGLDWYKRLSIAAGTAGILAYLQCEISPPIFHCGLKASGYIFLDVDFSVKVSSFACLALGTNYSDMPRIVMEKIKSGKLEEIVDPSLYYHEQPIARREQIEIVADVATRCLLFGGDGKIRMIDVARELIHLVKENNRGSKRGPALEETFSNSSLLQMISMSPDSIHLP